MPNQPKKPRGPTNGWDVLGHLVTLSFNSGYALFLLGGLVFLAALAIISNRLESKDLKDLLGGVLGGWFWGLGWLLFLGSTVIYFVAFRWIQKHYEAELNRQRELLERYLPPDTRKELDLK